MKKVLIIGAGFLQDFVICKAKRMGYETYTVDADANAIGFKHADHYKVVNIVDEKACLEYAKENGIDMPICEEVYQILFNGKLPSECAQDLMIRDLKKEF